MTRASICTCRADPASSCEACCLAQAQFDFIVLKVHCCVITSNLSYFSPLFTTSLPLIRLYIKGCTQYYNHLVFPLCFSPKSTLRAFQRVPVAPHAVLFGVPCPLQESPRDLDSSAVSYLLPLTIHLNGRQNHQLSTEVILLTLGCQELEWNWNGARVLWFPLLRSWYGGRPLRPTVTTATRFFSSDHYQISIVSYILASPLWRPCPTLVSLQALRSTSRPSNTPSKTA